MRKHISILVLVLACALALGIITYLLKTSDTREASAPAFTNETQEEKNSPEENNTAVSGGHVSGSAEDGTTFFSYAKDEAAVSGSSEGLFVKNEVAVSAEEASTSVDETSVSSGEISVSADEVHTPAKGSNTPLAAVSASVDAASTSVDAASTSVDAVSTSVDAVSTSVDAVSTSVDAVSTSVDAVSTSVDAVSTSVDSTDEDANKAADAEESDTASASEAAESDLPVNEHVVCLDPGHQSYDIDMSAGEPNGPGSSVTKAKASYGTQGTYTGIPEYALNLDVSLQVRDVLERRGYKVIMTRTDNETAISNMERALMAGEEGAEIFVRIHANGENSHTTSGALALCPSESNPYVGQLSKESHRLSDSILNAYCEATGFSNLGVQENDTMTGINWSSVPVTILEMGFMTNESDDTQMANAEFREIMARGIANGIDSYFGIDTSAYEAEESSTSAEGGEAALSVSAGQADGTQAGLSGTQAALQQDAVMQILQPQLEARLPKDNGQWSVYVGDLSTGSAASINSRPMQAASLIKLYIMGAVYENYERITAVHDAAEVDKLLHAMITASDNDAANTLTTYLGEGDSDVGMKMVTSYCTSHGYMDSSMGRLLLHSNEFGDNYTSVQDCGLFLTRIYNNCSGVSSDLRWADAMYSLLKQQTRTNKIPSQLPPNVHVANKTGELGDVENDAGIIYDTASGNDLVVCFMSEEVRTPGAAQTAIGELSKYIYSYYNE
ncbi:MAG: N-acetylmuramoyl-L-alanine amidase [Eubacterium sp.]|nr:N-acetylmuramoyl-L-alanine amidase [Eubacterium sp.]